MPGTKIDSVGLLNAAGKSLNDIRVAGPLVHQITNYVVMNETANMTLCLGASPVMAHAPEEVAEMASFSGALVLNIGTLTWEWIDSMIAAGKQANASDVPVVLDPVGAGATQMRTAAAAKILENVAVAVVRGNASEIAVLSGHAADIKGVDAVGSIEGLEKKAREMSRIIGSVVAITGAIDVVSDGTRVAAISNGDPMMARVTGTGCMSSAITGGFCAVDKDIWQAASSALVAFGIAGEKAAASAQGRPGTFHVNLYDEVALLTAERIASCGRITVS